MPETDEEVRPPYPGAASSNPHGAGQKTEKVYKMFTSQEEIEVIKASPDTLTIGSGDEKRKVTIFPLNPRQMIKAYGLIQEIVMPLAALFRPNTNISLADLIAAIGPNIEKVPELVGVILERGNNVSQDWIENNLDILLDLQIIIPVFLRQNALDKMFGPKGESGVPTSKPGSPKSAQTAA
jgi:hypothetical protein